MSQHEDFIAFTRDVIHKIIKHKEFASLCEVDLGFLQVHDQFVSLYTEIVEVVKDVPLVFNYVNQFQGQIGHAIGLFALKDFANQVEVETHGKVRCREMIEQNRGAIETVLTETQFTLSFFRKLAFFSKNIVAIGANGSGKTSLANDLKRHLTQSGIVISAQKILVVPTFSSISNVQNTVQRLHGVQSADKTLRQTYLTENGGIAWNALHQAAGEFQILLDNLLADRSAIWNKYCEQTRQTEQYSPVPTTNLDKVIDIWNFLLTHRTLTCDDGINLTLTPKDGGSIYPAHFMSDGEKVILFLVAQVLQAPTTGFIVVDEPETYLHKTILSRLWDRLESERPDCIFIYLTHDLDFAVSRERAKKIWIKSFSPPDEWEIEDIPSNEIPEPLLLELLGSRRDVLFCEGKKESLDTKIFEILFPQFTICPVSSCLDVISHTKAFNRIPNSRIKALGVVDRDYHSEARLQSLQEDNVYNYSVAEVENLFLLDTFLMLLAEQLLKEASIVDKIKAEVISQLASEKEFQISNFISAKINYYFNDSHVTRGRDLNAVKLNLEKFVSEVDVDGWYSSRLAEINTIVSTKNYSRALQIFNNKGLKSIAQRHLKLTDFSEMSLNLLRKESGARDALRDHFPEQLRME